jgi:HSP20 family protein
LRLFDRSGDDDFFPSPASFLLDPRTFAPSLLTSALPQAASTAKQIALDVVEKPEAFEIKADLPGVKESNVKVTVDGDVLSLSVENQEERDDVKEENGVKVHRVERSINYVRRAIRLPESADTERIKADLNDGVLHVHIPKAEKAEKQRRITVGRGANGAQAIAENKQEEKASK